MRHTDRERSATGDADRRELIKIEKSIKGILDLIEGGSGSRSLVERLRTLESQQDDLTERLTLSVPEVPDIHPNIGEAYRRKVESLSIALENPETCGEAITAICGLIERITITPGSKRGEIVMTLSGNLATLVACSSNEQHTRQAKSGGMSVSVVAGACSRFSYNSWLGIPPVTGGKVEYANQLAA
jgi:hypothetical protein